MTFRPAIRTTIGNGGRDTAFADYDRARDFATECWRRALRQRVRPFGEQEN